jgi:two-component system sensor histidine kinase CiaH
LNSVIAHIRWRLVGWSVLVLSVILIVLGAILYGSLTRSLLDAIDSSLETSSRTAQVELAETSESDLARAGYQGGLFFLLIDANGTILANPQDVGLNQLPVALAGNATARFATVDLPTDSIRIYVRSVPQPGSESATLVVGQSLAPEREAERRLLLILLLGGSVGLLLSFVGAAFLADRALVPIQEAFRRQQEFVADASHELRTPLTILHSAMDLLDQHAAEPLQSNKEVFDEARQEVVRMERLTRDLLELARSDRAEMQLAFGQVDLGALASELVQRVGPIAIERGIALELQVEEPAPEVDGDPDRLQQAGLILLDNALKHSPRGGQVRVLVSLDGDDAVLEVADSGERIPAEHLQRVFNRFYRVDRARSRSTGGAGLGLAIAHTLVTVHGGEIKLHSRPGQGTVATIRLPRAASGPDASDEHPQTSLTRA